MVAEVYIGRAAADSEQEVLNFVTKTAAYVRGEHAHRDRVLQAGEWLRGGGDIEYATQSLGELIGTCTALSPHRRNPATV
jgi:hypothetical protein